MEDHKAKLNYILYLSLALLKLDQDQQRCKVECTTPCHILIKELDAPNSLSHTRYGHARTCNELVIFGEGVLLIPNRELHHCHT